MVTLAHLAAPLDSVPLVICSAKLSWGLTLKGTIRTHVPQAGARSLAPPQNSDLMYAIPCNRTSSTAHPVKAEVNAATANAKAPALGRK